MAKKPTIKTTSGGNPVADDRDTLKAGAREIMQVPCPGAVMIKCLAVNS